MSNPKTRPAAPADFQPAAKAAELVRSTLAAIHDQQARLKTERAQLQQRCCTLYALPVLRSEAKDFVLGLIDARAQGFDRRAGWAAIMELFAQPKGMRALHQVQDGQVVDVELRHSGPLNMDDIERTLGARRDPVTSAPGYGVLSDAKVGFLGEPDAGRLLDSALYFLLGDLLKEKVGAYFDRHYPEPHHMSGNTPDGMALDERRGELLANEARVIEIDAELQTLAEQAATLTTGVPAPAASFGYSMADLRGAK